MPIFEFCLKEIIRGMNRALMYKDWPDEVIWNSKTTEMTKISRYREIDYIIKDINNKAL